MDAGKLNRPVTFRRETLTPDGAGGYIRAWTDYYKCMAAFEPERSREKLKADRIESLMAGVLRIRWSPVAAGLVGTDRVTIDGVEYSIRGKPQNVDMRRDEIEMILETVTV